VFDQDEFERLLAKGSVEALRSGLERLFALPPSRRRDGRVARIFLELSRRTGGKERERAFLAGYSYARTSRDPQARLLAERLRREFETWKR